MQIHSSCSLDCNNCNNTATCVKSNIMLHTKQLCNTITRYTSKTKRFKLNILAMKQLPYVHCCMYTTGTI